MHHKSFFFSCSLISLAFSVLYMRQHNLYNTSIYTHLCFLFFLLTFILFFFQTSIGFVFFYLIFLFIQTLNVPSALSFFYGRRVINLSFYRFIFSHSYYSSVLPHPWCNDDFDMFCFLLIFLTPFFFSQPCISNSCLLLVTTLAFLL